MSNAKFKAGDIITVSRAPENSHLLPYCTYKVESITNDVVCLRNIHTNQVYKEDHKEMTLISAFQYRILLAGEAA